MKLQILSAVHPEYPKQFYKKHPQLEKKSFREQKCTVDYDSHSWADFWSHALKPYDFEVAESNVNFHQVQKAWARENGIPFRRSSWIRDTAFEQVKDFQPEILFLADFSHFDLNWLNEVKASCPRLRLTLVWYGSYYPNVEIFKSADAVLSCIPELVAECKSQGLRSYHLNHAFESRVLSRLKFDHRPRIDFSFVGQIARGTGLHNQRLKILKEIAKQFHISIYTPKNTGIEKWKAEGEQYVYGFARNLKAVGVSSAVLKEIPLLRKAAASSEPPDQMRPLNSYLKPPVFGLDMFQTLKDSSVTFNQHIDVSVASASNMRLFEATGVGTCLMTDWKENLAELFELEKEVVTYKNADECVEKVKWLLDHPMEIQMIAEAGQQRTLKDHTFQQRGAAFHDLVRKLVS